MSPQSRSPDPESDNRETEERPDAGKESELRPLVSIDRGPYALFYDQRITALLRRKCCHGECEKNGDAESSAERAHAVLPDSIRS